MKRKVKLDRPEISSEEIAKGKDFKSVLSKLPTTPVAKPFYQKWGFIGGSLAVVAVVTTLLVVNPFKEDHVSGWDYDTPSKYGAFPPADSTEVVKSERIPDFTYAKKPGSPFIAPPFPDLDVKFEKHTINADKGGQIKTKKGSTLNFPAGGLKDDQGNPIKGNVEVKVREFHDPVDFFLSGIPMTYDSAGIKYHFESAGMVEVYAFQGGKVLKVDPKKPVKVELATNNAEGSYNVYQLDQGKKNWEYKGKDKLSKGSNSGAVVSPEVEKQRPILFENSVQVVDQKIMQVQKEINQLQNTCPIEPKQHTKGRYTFNIDVSKKEFPELNIYKDVLWEVDPSNTDFTEDMYKITWEDAVIKEGEARGKYQIVLKSRTMKKVFSVSPVFEGKDYENAKKMFDSKFSQYQTQLNMKKDEEQKLQKQYDELMKQIKEQTKTYNENMLAEMEKNKAEQEKQMQLFTLKENVFRTFSIAGFGIWNCDNPHLRNSLPFSAITYYPNGQRLDNLDVCLVNLKLNGIVTSWVAEKSTFSTKIASGKNMAWTISPDKKLLVCMEKEFTYAKEHPDNKGLVTLTFTEAPVNTDSPDAIKEYLFGTLSLK